jgi:hypothetical protein
VPSTITVAWRSKNAPADIRSSYDLGRELIALGRKLQADASDVWAAQDGGVITDRGIPMGAYKTEDAPDAWLTGGERCRDYPNDEHRQLVEHFQCQSYRDGVITEVGGGVVYEPDYPTLKGRIRV